MQKIELTSKLVLAIIGLTAVGAILVPTYAVPTIKSADIFDGTIQSVDIKNGAIQLNVHIVKGPANTLEAFQTGDSVADCPAGEILTGGGWSGQAGAKVRTNAPVDENSWRVLADNEVAGTQQLQAYALCIDPTIP